MTSRNQTTRILGLPVVMGMLINPAYASTPDALSATSPIRGGVEIIFPEFAQVGGDDIGGSAD